MPPAQKKPQTHKLSDLVNPEPEAPKTLGMRWFFDPRAVNAFQRDQDVSTELLAAELLTRAGVVEKHEKLIPGIAKVIEDVYCR